MAIPPFKVKAVYEYKSPHYDDLSFPIGQVITVTEEEDADWYVGEYTDGAGDKQEGLFPRNFVEKYEPEAPPRPTRTRVKKEAAPAVTAEPAQAIPDPTPEPVEPVAPQTPIKEPSEAPKVATPTAVSPPPKPAETIPEPKPEPPKPGPAAKGPPPPVSEKPSSFKDRIAAFNRPQAQPLAPVKPGPAAGGGAGFIKKPFVAPPPSRNAFVPPPRDPASQKATVYRRDEDPEIKERQALDQESAEKAGLTSTETPETAEDEPKSTSLKDRIALLQAQQQEQAARRADVSQKEKPKKPQKKRTESSERIATAGAIPTEDGAPLEKETSAESRARDSIDDPRETPKQSEPVRRSSRSQQTLATETVSDGNEADQSGAGDTTEDGGASSTEIEEDADKESHFQATPPPRTSTTTSREAPQSASRDVPASEAGEERERDEDGEENEEDEEESEDEETRRKRELRERMAKMSGGMGMPGMFAIPPPGPAYKKKRPSGTSEQKSNADQDGTSSPQPTQRVPMVPVPGVPRMHSPPPMTREPEVTKEPEEDVPLTAERGAEEVPDVGDLKRQPSMPSRPNERAAHPMPQGKSRPRWSPTKQSRDIRRKALARSSKSITDLGQKRTYSAYDGAPVMLLMSRGSNRPLPPPPPSTQRGAAPPVPGARPVPQTPEVLSTSNPPPRGPPPTAEEAENGTPVLAQAPTRASQDLPARGPPPPIPGLPQRPDGPRSPPVTHDKRASFLESTTSPLSAPDKRQSRAVPPPPGPAMMPPIPTSETRPPPPPPPTAAPPTRRANTHDSVEEPRRADTGGGESDYEGDYDTDIAPGADHKSALNDREPSADETTLSEEPSTMAPPTGVPPSGPPPIPGMIQRGPPPPPHGVPASRKSADAPRAPPPAPPSRITASQDDDYDPYAYSAPRHGVSSPPPGEPMSSSPIQASDPALYGESSQSLGSGIAVPSTQSAIDRGPPPPPPGTSRASRDTTRPSMDAPRRSMTAGRASADQSWQSAGQGQMAQDVDLGQGSQWWVQPNTPPPVFQKRNDVLCEFDDNTTSKRGGRTTISRDVYVLFPDYSQTVVTAQFDSKNTSDVVIEQRHEPPPPRLRQDQLEEAYNALGTSISTAATQRSNSTVGDGTAQAFILEILRAQDNALLPVGTRAYGALVYANMANATVIQHDEIRAGDIISFRNTRFSGKHGAMHAKYSEDVGKPEHVGVVVEWDGTKKKVRALEQGRESKKVKVESFRVGDLRSGEVKVWRVMDRKWVGWDSGS